MEHKISLATKNNGILGAQEFINLGINKSDIYGVVVQTETIGLIMSLQSWKEEWGRDDTPVDVKDDEEYIGEAKALQTLSGLDATKRIIDAHNGHEGMYAAKRCFEYQCAGIQWYLPSLYELGTIAAYKDEINAVLSAVELSEFQLKNEYHWSSSENIQTYAWLVYFSNGYFNYYYKYISYVVRAVSAFSSLSKRSDLSSAAQKDEEQLVFNAELLSDDDMIAELKKRGYKGSITKTLTL